MTYDGVPGDHVSNSCELITGCSGAVFKTTECYLCDPIDISMSEDGNLKMHVDYLTHNSGFATVHWNCPIPTIYNITGYWNGIGSSPGPQDITYEYGISHSYEVDNTQAWGNSVTQSVGGGFSFLGFSKQQTVSGTTSSMLSETYSNTFSMAETITYTHHLDYGYVWQWVWKIEDSSGTSIARTMDISETKGAYEQPCCLPGWFKDPQNPMGECHSGADGELFSNC